MGIWDPGNPFGQFLADTQYQVGKTISKLGAGASWLPGVNQDIRIGGGIGLGGRIAGQNQAFSNYSRADNGGASNEINWQPNNIADTYQQYAPSNNQTGGGNPTGQVLGQNTQQTNSMQGQGDAAAASAKAELEDALNQLDYLGETMLQQKTEAGQQKESALSSLGSQFQSAEQRAKGLTTEAQESTTSGQRKALSTAQDVTKSNRNVLRALGILSSSAAGEMLTRPLEEYGIQAADLQQAFVKRKGQVEDWLSERFTEFNQAKTNVQTQFDNIVAKIDQDLRFNKRDKITAVKNAQAAFQETIATLNAQAQSYAQAADEYKNNMLTQIAQLQQYQKPQADTSGILSQMITSPTQAKPMQVGTLMSEEEQRKKGLLSA